MSRSSVLAEHEADRAAGQALAGRVPARLAPVPGPSPDAARELRPSGRGQALEAGLRTDMETRFGHSFADVRVHTDSAAAGAAKSLRALAFTHGHHIAFGASRFAPHSPAGRHLLAHELAHVVQQTQPGGVPRTMLKPQPQGAGAPSDTSRAGTGANRQEFDPDADQLSAQLDAPLAKGASPADRSRQKELAQARRQLRVNTEPVDIDYEPYFDTRGGTTSMPLPPRTTVQLAGGMASTLHRGLTSVAADLIDRKHLGPQIILTLALDLTPFGGGHDAYRFTRIDLGSGKRTRSEVWIERQGKIGAEGLDPTQRKALDLRFKRLGFQNENIGMQELDQVLIAVSEVPESQLAGVRGLSFRRESVHATDPKAAASYHPGTHTIRIFDRALAQSQTRLGRQGRVLRYATHAIVHEIGHALDMGGLRQADSAFDAANQNLMDRYGVAGGGYEGPDSKDPDRPRFDATLKAFKQAQEDRLKARGRSGARWVSVKRAPLTIEDQGPGREPTPAFRAAALKDDGTGGPRVPTTRPKPEPVWQEYYAESFALYQSSPDLLKRIRPHVFAHLAAEFPK